MESGLKMSLNLYNENKIKDDMKKEKKRKA